MNNTNVHRGVVLAMVLSLCAVVLTAQGRISDREIVGSLRDRVAGLRGISPDAITFDSRNGAVVISGAVTSFPDKMRVENAAAAMEGVLSIDNRISVNAVSRPDPEILVEVERSIENAVPDGTGVPSVDVSGGKVLLSGTVENASVREVVVRLAGQTEGVRGITDTMTVVAPSPRPDEEIHAEIVEKLRRDVWVQEDLIAVAVDGPAVRLSGYAATIAAKRHAVKDAWVPGVGIVDESALLIDRAAAQAAYRQAASTLRSDTAVLDAVTGALSSLPALQDGSIAVSVSNGVVTLAGAATPEEARKATDLATAVPGVAGVRNMLEVPHEMTMSDEEILADVREALLRNPFVDLNLLSVSVRDRIAVIEGEVPTGLEKAEAERSASGVPGVRCVRNNLSVKREPAGDPCPRSIREKVREGLKTNPAVEAGRFTVQVKGNVTTLSGTARSWSEKSAVLNEAVDAGADFIEDNIVIEGMLSGCEQAGASPDRAH